MRILLLILLLPIAAWAQDEPARAFAGRPIVDVIEEDFLSGRLPRSNLFLDSLTRTPLEWIRRVGGYDGLDDDPPFAAPT